MSWHEKTERLHELLREQGIEYECHNVCNESVALAQKRFRKGGR